jgi:hypothetical protein
MPYFRQFAEYKITGSLNWAYGYKKPMLMHEELANMKTFKDASIGYTTENIVETINNLSRDLSPIAELVQNISKDPRFDFETQKKLYDQFIQKALI